MKRIIESYGLLLALIALAYFPVLDTWWFHDDWVFLANAAGIEARPNSLVRWFSYQAYWKAFWPVFGLQTWPWALTRLGLLFGSAVLVGRVGRLVGQKRTEAALAALVLAASPVAFESMYWGTGAVELLWVFFTLWSAERWMRGGARNRRLALALAAAAILSKEVAVFLVPLFAWDLRRRGVREGGTRAGLAGLALLGAAGVLLIFRDVQGTGDYALSLADLPRVFLVCGFWLIAPASHLGAVSEVSALGLLCGAGVWSLWGLMAYHRLQLDNPWPLVLLAAAVAMVLPVAVLGDHAVPRYLLGPQAAFALFLLSFLRPAKLRESFRTVLMAALVLTVLAMTTVAYQQEARWPSGRARHRLVFKEEVSRAAAERLRRLDLPPGGLLALRPAAGTDQGQVAVLKEAVGGSAGIRMMVGRDAQVVWLGPGEAAPEGATVLEMVGANLVPPGPGG
ncbi:MAG: hypothetical protein AB7V45_07765 [Candidatus Krumholzibacteriia bacterium]